jgi:hypothetical protein
VLKDKDQIAASEVAYFKVPVTSVKAWAAYVKTLDAVYHRHPMGVVTELSVVPDVKNQLAVIFTEKGIIKDSGTGAAILQKAAEVKQAITFPYVKFERTAAPKKGKKKHSKKY